MSSLQCRRVCCQVADPKSFSLTLDVVGAKMDIPNKQFVDCQLSLMVSRCLHRHPHRSLVREGGVLGTRPIEFAEVTPLKCGRERVDIPVPLGTISWQEVVKLFTQERMHFWTNVFHEALHVPRHKL